MIISTTISTYNESASLTLVKGDLDGIVRARELSTDVMRKIVNAC